MRLKNMKRPHGLKKRMAAVTLSLVMVFGAAAVLPQSLAEKGLTTASAYNIKDGGHTFYYEITGDSQVRITGVSLGDKVLTVPSKITVDGKDYTVTEIGDNFAEGCSIYAASIPDTVTKIGDNFINNCPIDTLHLPESLEYIGDRFCYNCVSLKTVEFDGTKLTHMGAEPFSGEGLLSYHFRYRTNRQVSCCFGEWLIAYYGTDKEINVAELGGDTPVKYIAAGAFTPDGALYYKPEDVTSVDLTGIEYIGDNAFKGCKNLEEIKGGDDIEYVGAYGLYFTKWFSEKKPEDMVKLGKELLWYRSNDTVVDLSKGDLKELKHVNKHALQGCPNAEGIRARSDLDITDTELPKTIENGKYAEELNGLSELYIDGKEVEFDSKKMTDPFFSKYAGMLSGTQMESDLLRDKTKAVFSQLGIKYYGIGTFTADLTVQESYDLIKKIHDYIAENYTFGSEARTLLDGYIGGKRMDSEELASLYAYMLRCAGIESLTVKCDAKGDNEKACDVYDHSWVLVKLDNNWYHSDVCWDSASQGNTMKYFLLSDSAVKELPQHDSWEISNPMGLNIFNAETAPECSMLHGDTNGDGQLTAEDLEAYMGILKTKKVKASAASDVDLDGDTDINDMFMLDDILNTHPFKPTNQNSKPENEIMALNARCDEKYEYSVGQVKVIIAGESEIYNKDFLLSGYDGSFILPEFKYKTSEYEEFEKWELGKPGDEIKFTQPVVILRPVWVDDVGRDNAKKGDVNHDGTVDIVDAVTVISHINGTSAMSNKSMKAADVNLDKKVDIEDAVLIIGYVNGNNTL